MILIYTAVYGRHEIFQTFLNNLPNYPLVVVGQSNDKCKQVYDNWINPNDTYWIEHENLPLGKKWNQGLKHLKEFDFDYLFITGSDDIFEPRLFEYYEELAKQDYALIGLEDFYFYDFNKMRYNPGFRRQRKGLTHGAGRMIHRRLIEALDWDLWNEDINSGLDGSMDNRLRSIDYKSKLVNLRKEDLFAVDLKTIENIHQMEEYNGSYVSDLSILKRVKL